MRALLFKAAALALLAWAAAPAPAAARADRTEGKFEVTARLVKIPAAFPPDELYDYAFVMRYEVVGGKLDKQPLLVAHYKPRQGRDKITDKMKKYVGGKLKRFKEGDLHRLLLAPKLKKIWRGALVDEFFAVDRKSTRYWCLQVDPAPSK